MRAVAVGSSVLEVVQKRWGSLRDVVVLEVPERVEEGIGISVLGEADAQEVLDWVTAVDGDIVVVVSVPISSNEPPDTFGHGIVSGGGRSSISSAEDHRAEASPVARYGSG
jgi:hypothetical protein